MADRPVQQRLPFGTDIWTTEPRPADVGPLVQVSIYGEKTGRLFAGGDADYDHLWLQVGEHTLLVGPTYCWEEFAQVLNKALRQRDQYREALGERTDAQVEAER